MSEQEKAVRSSETPPSVLNHQIGWWKDASIFLLCGIAAQESGIWVLGPAVILVGIISTALGERSRFPFPVVLKKSLVHGAMSALFWAVVLPIFFAIWTWQQIGFFGLLLFSYWVAIYLAIGLISYMLLYYLFTWCAQGILPQRNVAGEIADNFYQPESTDNLSRWSALRQSPVILVFDLAMLGFLFFKYSWTADLPKSGLAIFAIVLLQTVHVILATLVCCLLLGWILRWHGGQTQWPLLQPRLTVIVFTFTIAWLLFWWTWGIGLIASNLPPGSPKTLEAWLIAGTFVHCSLKKRSPA